MRLTLTAATLALSLAFLPAGGMLSPLAAQANLFAPRVLVDDMAVTNYEYDQRMRFMTLLQAPGDLRVEAERTLIEDRLRMIAAKRLKIRLTEAQVIEGMTEFAGRAGLTAEEFVTALEENGVSAQTFRDFVTAGMLWREVVRGKFGPLLSNVPDAAVDRSLSIPAQRGSVRLLLAEIVLPANAGALATELAQTVRGEGAFGAAARQHSTAESAARGGRLDWVPVANLPVQLVGLLQGLPSGGVTPPIPVAGGIAIYQLRGIEEKDEVTPATTAVEYAQFLIPGAGTPAAEAEAARVRAATEVCGDLYPLARGLPEDRLTVETKLLPALPADIALELARLDEGESSTRLTRGGWQVFLMLCSRRVASDLPPDRDAIRERLITENLGGQAEIYLQELRSNAHIRRP